MYRHGYIMTVNAERIMNTAIEQKHSLLWINLIKFKQKTYFVAAKLEIV